MVQLFRRPNSPYVSGEFRLRGLDLQAVYEVMELDKAPRDMRASGKVLMDSGLTVTIPQRPAATVLVYRRMGQTKPGSSGQAKP